MPYATQDDLVQRFGREELAQLTDRLQGSEIIDDTVARALADAEAEIDARIGARYALPLASVPTVLVRVACDIARYFLWGDGASPAVRERFEDAQVLLKAVAQGSVQLPAAQPLAPGGDAVAVQARSDASQFAGSGLDAFTGRLR